MALPRNWQELIMLFGTFQGLILILAMASRKRKSPANRLLIWFILALVFLLFSGVGTSSSTLAGLQKKMGFIGDTVSFLYGPLLYLYTGRLLLIDRHPGEWKHFIPALIFFPTNIIFQSIGFDQPGSGFYSLYFTIFGFVAFTQFFVYLYLSFKLISFYKTRITQELSYRPPINYLLTVLSFVSVCLLLFFVDFLNVVLNLDLGLWFFNYNHSWTLISLLTFILAYYAIINPEIFRVNSNLATNEESRLDDKEVEQITSRLVEKMKLEKLFLNSELTLTLLAEHMNVRKEVLSKSINQGLSMNFYRFVNGFRVEEFKRRVEAGSHRHMTHLGIAHESGFKSKTTFYKAFKEITGVTPSQYLKKPSS